MSRQRVVTSLRRRNRRLQRLEPLEDRHLLTLVISEINYQPYAQVPQFGEVSDNVNDYEFIELFNTGPQPVNMQGMQFIQVTIAGEPEGIVFSFPALSLAAGERIVVANDLEAFASRYGTNVRVAGEWAGGALGNNGETLTLVNPNSNVVLQMTYDSNEDWPTRAAGRGSTLEIIAVPPPDPVDPDAWLSDPDSWQSSREFGGTPGTVSQAPREARVLFNEVLAHTDPPQRDAVEFHNVTNAPINVSGWYFAAGSGNPFRFRFPAGSIIPANGYLTIDERHFNPGGGDLPNDFAISELGEDLRLISANAQGRPLLLEDYVVVGATANGVSVGNVGDVRAGSELVTLAALTLNAANGGHQVAPAVISEIQYRAPDDDPYKEFIEIQNTTNAQVDLQQWTINDALDVTLPAGTSLAPGEAIVLVAFSPADQARVTAFRDYYAIDETVRLIGPWGTNNAGDPQGLSNNGESITLRTPLVDAGEVYLAMADQVDYNDADPWPEAADGDGGSLTRLDVTNYGNLPESWQAALPTPGNLPIDYSDAPLLVVDTPVTAQLGRDDQMLRGTTDVDVFRFAPAAAGTFEFVAETVGAGAQTALRVFSSDQEEIGFSNHPTGSTENRLSVPLEAGAEYYVVVSGSSLDAQNYNPFTGANLVSSAAIGEYRITVEGGTSSGSPWQNGARPTDVNASGTVDPIDALLIINQLNTIGAVDLPAPSEAFAPPPYIDVTGDNFLSPIDALMVINELNAASGAAEAEPVMALPQPAASQPLTPSLVAAAIDELFAEDDHSRLKRQPGIRWQS